MPNHLAGELERKTPHAMGRRVLRPEIGGEIANGRFGHGGVTSAAGATPPSFHGFHDDQVTVDALPCQDAPGTTAGVARPLNAIGPAVSLDRKDDDQISRFGLMRRQAGRIGIAPVGKIYNRRLLTRLRGLGRLHDVESVAVEEERVIPEQLVQLRNQWMVVGNGLGFELAQGSLDLCGSQFHRTLLFDWGRFDWAARRGKSLARCGPPTSRWSNTAVGSVIPHPPT